MLLYENAAICANTGMPVTDLNDKVFDIAVHNPFPVGYDEIISTAVIFRYRNHRSNAFPNTSTAFSLSFSSIVRDMDISLEVI